MISIEKLKLTKVLKKTLQDYKKTTKEKTLQWEFPWLLWDWLSLSAQHPLRVWFTYYCVHNRIKWVKQTRKVCGADKIIMSAAYTEVEIYDYYYAAYRLNIETIVHR